MPGLRLFSRSLSLASLIAVLSIVFHPTDLSARRRDTTPPSVAISTPSAGATVSGTVTVAASASDNVGVASVQFKLDGVNLGAKDTIAPYSIAWNTTGMSGSHTLAAVAMDAAGNTRTSAAVTVTVTAGPADTTPPVISAVAASSISSAGATIGWTTDEPSDSQVEYGLTTTYGSTSAVNSSLVTTHSVALGLSASTTYHYRVRSRDAAGNLAVSADAMLTTMAPSDTTAPTVSITAPAAGATVSAAVTVSAAASDNVGVAGVQFRLDGTNLGAEVTSAPFTAAWDTTATANGSHTLTAVARDAAGNRTTSAGMTITVSNLAPPTNGRQFYVDNMSGSDSNNGTAPASPWKSLSKVNGTTFQAGDTINFNRGSVWTGTLTVSGSGASGNPITFQDYGSGNAPLIQRATAPESSGYTRTVVITGSWIVVQNFRITNAHEAGIFLDTAANHNVIRNNEITATGYGTAVYGQFNLLTQNYVHDLHIIVNNAGGGNYGAGCFFFQQAGSGGNELSYNRGINCRAQDSFFDYNGKFVEVFNNGDNLYIHHNYAENVQGFFEAGAGGGSRTATNIRFVYNVLVNSHADAAQPTTSIWFNTTGSYGITMSNFVFDNNTVYQRTGDGGVYRMFGSSSDLSFMTVRNNIFSTDTQIANTGSFRHTNNLYYMANMVSGSGVGYSLGTGEKNADPLFVNVSGRDFHLQLSSPAIDAGIDLGYTTDMAGTAVPQAVSSLLPDIGAYEYKP